MRSTLHDLTAEQLFEHAHLDPSAFFLLCLPHTTEKVYNIRLRAQPGIGGRLNYPVSFAS